MQPLRSTCHISFARVLATVIGFGVALSYSATVAADDRAAEADLRFELGTKEYANGRYAEALHHFLASQRLVHNKNVTYNIALCYQQLKRYPEAYRYFGQALSAETDERVRARISQSLRSIERRIVVVQIVTNPPGATIYINRKDLGSVGNAPLSLGLAPGNHRLIAESPGHFAAEQSLRGLKPGQRLRAELKLSPELGTVVLDQPPGIRVFAKDPSDGATRSCTSPCRLRLPTGLHTLTLKRDGFLDREQTVNVARDSTAELNGDLEPMRGKLVVEADEANPLILVDGKVAGFAPAVFDLPVGSHRVEAELEGYESQNADIVIVEGEDEVWTVSLARIDEVIAASRHPESVQHAPSSVSIVPIQELTAFAYPTIAEALRGTRGVFLTDDRSYVAVGFRGLGRLGDYSNRVLTTLDGQPTIDNWLGSSFLGYDARTDLNDIERIEVVRGPGSALYGTSAFSGVINVVSRGRDEPPGVEAGISSYGEGVGRMRVRGTARFGDQAGLWAAAAVANSAGRDFFFPEYVEDTPPEVAGHARDADGFHAATLHGRAYFRFLTAQWFFHVYDKRLPTGVFETLLADDRARQRDTRALVEIRAEPTVSDQLKLLTRLHLNHYRFLGGYPRPEAEGGLGVDTYRGSWLGLEQRAVLDATPGLKLTLGAEGQLHFQVEQLSYDNAGTFLDEARPYQVGAGYGVFDLRLSDTVQVSLGGRLDAYSTFGSSVNPHVALIAQPYPGGNLKLLGGKAFRAPSVYELYYNDGGSTQIPSPDLDPETVYSLEIEHAHKLSTLVTLTASVFGNYVHDLIVTRGASTEADPLFYENSEHPLLSLGAELELRREWRQGYMAAINYSHQRSRYLADTSLHSLFSMARAPSVREVSNAPEHLVSLKGAMPLLGPAVTLASRVTLEGPRYDRYESIDEPEQARTQAFALWDVILSGNDPDMLHWAVGIYNAFDTRYSLPVGPEHLMRTIRQNGRTLALSADIRF